jgi:ferritin-like metal-binding protein YciE
MQMRSLRDVFTHELQDMHSAEKQILKALPKLIKKAGSPELQEALEDHRMVTEEQVTRLEEILGTLDGAKSTTKKCKGMAGILEEGEELLKENPDGDGVLDAAMIGAAQKVEHYEIAAYGTLVAFAKHLGEDRALELLEQSLDEEKSADEKLSEIAANINEEANTEA